MKIIQILDVEEEGSDELWGLGDDGVVYEWNSEYFEWLPKTGHVVKPRHQIKGWLIASVLTGLFTYAFYAYWFHS